MQDTATFMPIANGTYTLKSSHTGQHRTVRIKTQADDAKFAPGRRILSVLTGPNNDDPRDYLSIGFVNREGTEVKVWARFIGTAHQGVAQVLQDLLVTGPLGRYASTYTISGARHCIRCNRLLTTPESITAGIGPVCAGRQ